MTDLVIRVAAPLPSAQRGRASKKKVATWEARQREIRTCYVCKTTYVSAGYAWRCERWHWRQGVSIT